MLCQLSYAHHEFAGDSEIAALRILLDGRPERPGSERGDRAVAHATQGPCLQQNLVCVLEGE